MAISDAFQTLTAAFTFGTLFQAAAPAILLFTKGHGKAIFKDGRRLVLVLFLLFAALWAQIEFLTLMMPTTMTGTCSLAVIVSTAFDQMARVMIEQFLLWSVGHGTKMTKERLVLQGILLLRIAAGGVFVGFTRRDFAPTCVAQTSVLPVGIVVLAFDVVIFGVLIVRAMSLGLFSEMKKKTASKKQQSRALVFSIIGLGIWTGTSVPMILGIPSLILLLRTVLPANGLLILASIIVGYSIALLVVKDEDGITPEARSPFMNPMPPTRELFQENTSNTGSPVVGHGYTRSGSLFVVNPSTPNDSPTIFQGSARSGDTKGFTKLSEEITVTPVENSVPTRPERPDGKQARKGPGYRGSSGVFASISAQGGDQGAVAPQIRPNITASREVIATDNPLKRSIFSRSKLPPKSNIRSLGISQPIALNSDGSSSQPFVKIPTIDLATAAKMEHDRRNNAAARSKLIALRPAPPPPIRSSEGSNVTRKVSSYLVTKPMPSIPGSTAGSSIGGMNGSTTSASLSPGREEVRRRSPRNRDGFDQILGEKVAVQQTLQRNQTIGLPSNPRAQRAMIAREAGMAIEQTAMLINKIEYNQPELVKQIIKDAPKMYANRPKTADASIFTLESTLKSSNSIIHRPRPYKKADASKDRQLFPTESSLGHRRSKSSSSIIRQKSILRSQPGSPTHLPPLPPPPTMASKLVKILPSDTKSMTLDEKIQLLFPAPPGPIDRQYRRSSVPSIPRVPSMFMDGSLASSPTEEEQQSRRTSKRTTLASFGLDNPDITASSPRENLKRPKALQTSHFSAITYQTNTDESNESTLSRMNLLEVPIPQSDYNDLHQSQFVEANIGDDSLIDDAITNWASIQSKVPVIDQFNKVTPAQSTFNQRVKNNLEKVASERASRLLSLSQHGSTKTVPLVVELEESRRSFLFDSSADKDTFFLDDGQTPINYEPMQRRWHRRIGDELPTFSERMKPRARKMPPPTPLLLTRNGRKAMIVVRNSEPSPPIDSPERAIKEIQEQLKRFEDTSRVSVGSLLGRLPNGNQVIEQSQDTDRLRLLNNLEMEIGQQENLWQQMQTNLDRDSMSIATPKQEPISRDSSQRSSKISSRVLARRSRIESGLIARPQTNDSSRGYSTDSSDNSRASVWQQRLANAQMEYTANAPDILRKGSLNFLSVYKAPAGLGSPSPPESVESETDVESESENGSLEYVTESQLTLIKPALLWQRPIASYKAAVGRLWSQPDKRLAVEASHQLPAKDLRPAQRQTERPLQIFSVELWSKPRSTEHSRPVVGLWGSKLLRPRSIVTRPVTQKPARRSRRVTFLPDIVESPVPLPDKKETLGIFQFPWGEKSDQPVYQLASNPALLTGPVLNSQLMARSRQLESGQSDYSSSFFDDYEEEEEDDMIDQDSEDDFDESTLWEIATLLKSNDVPSKQSLLPHAKSMIEDYDSNDSEIEERLTEPSLARSPSMNLPIQPLEMPIRESPRVSLQRSSNQMWSPPQRVTNLPYHGLFHKQKACTATRTTEAIPAAIYRLKTPRKSNASLPTLLSNRLWAPGKTSKEEVIWITRAYFSPVVTNLEISTKMWSLPDTVSEKATAGLFNPSIPRTYRTTVAAPATINMTYRSQKPKLPPSTLVSSRLWCGRQKLIVERDWISESSIRPISPSIYSPSSSGASSPVSDDTSVRSTSTKASSVVSSISIIPSWWNIKSSNSLSVEEAKLAPKDAPVQDGQPSSKIPLRQLSKPLVPVRESRVLASRDMWESMAPVLEKIPSMKFRRAATTKKSAKPTRQAMRQQYRPNGTLQVSWEEALQEAIAASRMKPSTRRILSKSTIFQPVVTHDVKVFRPAMANSEADWENALSEAISMSIIPPTTPRYDAAVLHPVFFTEHLFSTVVDEHPAAIGHFTLKKKVGMWNPNVNISAPVNGYLWSKVVVSPKKSSSVHIFHGTVHKSLGDKKTDLPVLESTSLWVPTEEITPQRSWLFHRKLVSAQMWTPATALSDPENTGMWIVKPNREKTIPSLFAEIRGIHLKARSSHSKLLSSLNSSSLYQTRASFNTTIHWLHQTSKSATSMTWEAPVLANTEAQAGMWAIPTQHSPATPNLFPHPTTIYTRANPSYQSTLPVLISRKLFEVTLAKISDFHWLHQTSHPVHPKLWTAPAQSQPKVEVGLWAASAQPSDMTPSLFAHLHSFRVRATPLRPAILLEITSDKLFEFTAVAKTNTHWLHQTSKAPRSLTWTPLTAAKPSEPRNSMWTFTLTQTSASPALFAHLDCTAIRAGSNHPALPPLPRITSTSLFISLESTSNVTHWLHKTSKSTPITSTRKRSTTWTAPPPPIYLAPQATSTMWSAKPTVPRSLPSPMHFTDTHAEPWTRPKRSDSAVGGIESTELWQASASKEEDETDKNWIAGDSE